MLHTLVVVLLLVCLGKSTDIYVSPSRGSDSNPGTADLPVQTLYAAQLVSRATHPGNVFIEPDTYRLNSTLQFGPQDSGPVTWQPWGSLNGVIVSGSVVIPGPWNVSTSFTPVSPQCTLLAADLPPLVQPFNSMWVNGVRATQAKSATYSALYVRTNQLVYSAGQLPSGTQLPYDWQHVRLGIYGNWQDTRTTIIGINTTTMSVQYGAPLQQLYNGAAKNRFWWENIRESLDAPGEFYVDQPAGVIYYCARPGENANNILVEAAQPQLQQLVTILGGSATDITFAGITFQYSEIQTGDYGRDQSSGFLTQGTVHLTGTERITFDRCTFQHTGGYAVFSGQGTFETTVSNSLFYDLGCGGIHAGVQGETTDPSLRSANHIFSNNAMSYGGQYWISATGVFVQTASNVTIEHNAISYFPYIGISVGWSWGFLPTNTYSIRIQYNTVSHIGYLGVLSDMGCIYVLGEVGGTNGQFFSIVNNNECFNVTAYNYGAWGLYADEGASYVNFTNNVVHQTACAGMHQHFGVVLNWFNNVFANVNTWPACADNAFRSDPNSATCNLQSPSDSCSAGNIHQTIAYVTGQSSSGCGPYEWLSCANTNAWSNFNLDYNCYFSPSTMEWDLMSFTRWQRAGHDKHSNKGSGSEIASNIAANYNFTSVSGPCSSAIGFKGINTAANGPPAWVFTVPGLAQNGNWTEWEPANCTSGEQTRTCTNPPALYGGLPCQGTSQQPCA